MPAATNPFYVQPPDIYEALMTGRQSYDAARKDADQEQIKAARIQAGQAIQSGADPKMVLGTLMQFDPQTAAQVATMYHQQNTEKLTGQQIAETGRHNVASESQSAAQLAQTEKHQTESERLAREQEARAAAEPKTVSVGQELVVPRGPEAGKVVYKGSGGLSDSSIEIAARQDIGGDQSWKTNIGRGAQGADNIQKVMNRKADILVNEYGQSPKEAAELVGKQLQAFKAEGSGKMQEQRTLGGMEAKMGAAGFEAEGAIKLALPVIDKVPRTNFLPFNKLIVGYQNQTLNPDQFELFTRLQAIKNAYQAVMQRGANVNTVYAGHRADELLDSAANPDVLKRVLSTMQNEIDMARNAPQRMRDYYKKQYGPKGLEPSQNISDQGDITGVQVTNAPAQQPVKMPASLTPEGAINWAKAQGIKSGTPVILPDGRLGTMP